MASGQATGQHQRDDLEEMWMTATRGIQEIDPATENWKIQTLPLARIKKIMKSEEFILQELEKDRQEKLAAEGRPVDTDKPAIKFMISGEAPILMSKACELLIKDLTHRAWTHTERNRRRTLQRQDLHAAVGESEVYDFLIDIVPRVTAPSQKVHTNAPPQPPQGIPSGVAGLGGASHPGMVSAGIPPGMQMQIPTAMHTGIPVSASMPPGAMASIPEDATGMMQHMDPQQLAHAQAAQQQQQYHHDPAQHAATAIHLQHQHQQQVPQHHQAYARGQQDGTSPTPPSGQPEPAWLQHTATD